MQKQSSGTIIPAIKESALKVALLAGEPLNKQKYGFPFVSFRFICEYSEVSFTLHAQCIFYNINNNTMKKLLATLLVLTACLHVSAQESKQIRISTERTDLILEVAPNGRLYQAYLGDKLLHDRDLSHLSGRSRGWEVYPGSGGEDYFEPAVAITNNDGNPSTILRYVSSEQKTVEGGTETIIRMKDDQYPVDVTLHYVSYPKQNVIKTWSEITHQQKKPVTLWRYASTMLYFANQKYYLTEFSSDWAKEVQMSTQQLQPGKKILDTKLGSRAAMHMQPFFELGLEQPAQEHQGQVI